MGRLSGRVAALEVARAERKLHRLAERLALEYRLPVADVLEELRTISAEIARRFGPRPDLRAVANWMAAEHGRDPDEVYGEITAHLGREG